MQPIVHYVVAAALIPVATAAMLAVPQNVQTLLIERNDAQARPKVQTQSAG